MNTGIALVIEICHMLIVLSFKMVISYFTIFEFFIIKKIQMILDLRLYVNIAEIVIL